MALLKDLIVYGASRFLADAFGTNIYADKHITNGGTATQFLKGDGTLDSNTYATTSSLSGYVPTSRKINGQALSADVTLTLDNINDGSSRKLANYVLKAGDTMSGSLTATSFIKSGGTSSQFLKADGSVDSNTYLTSANLTTHAKFADTATAGQVLVSKATNTYEWKTLPTVYDTKVNLASNTGTTTQAFTLNSSADRTMTVKGDGTYLTGAVSGSANSVTVTINHIANTTAGTAGQSGASTGVTFNIPYVTYNAGGHITAGGTHEHSITGAQIATILSGQTVGTLTINNLTVPKTLLIPAHDPSATSSTDTAYLWLGTGLYSEIPGGGSGGGDVYDLTLRKNSVSLGTYNLGTSAADINIPINWSDLTPDSTHRFVSDAEKAIWNAGTQKTQAIPYIEGPDTDTTAGTWTGTYDGITALEEGLTIIYVPHVKGATTTTLNINGLGAKTCYYSGTYKLTTHYPVGTPILFTYHNNGWRRADYTSSFSAGTKALFDAGTDTGNRVWSAKVLADSVAPIVHTHVWSDITDAPTIPTVNDATLTIKKEGTSIGTFTANASSNVDINIVETDPTVPAWAKAANKPSYSFSEITNKPTTIAGYGITDAKIVNDTITLGSNSITPSKVNRYSLAPYSAVDIKFSASYHAIVSARFAMNSPDLVLIGSGYGATFVRNHFTQVNTQSGLIHWRYHSGVGVQIINAGSAAADIVVVCNTVATVTFSAAEYDTTSAYYDAPLALASALSGYVPTSRKVNNKALSDDITLSLDDIADGSTRKLTNYLPLTGGTLTGDVTTIADISFTTTNRDGRLRFQSSASGSNVAYNLAVMQGGTSPALLLGYGNNQSSKTVPTYLDGYDIYTRFGAANAYAFVLDHSGVIKSSANMTPASNGGSSLGTSAIRWSNLYTAGINSSGDITTTGNIYLDNSAANRSIYYKNSGGSWIRGLILLNTGNISLGYDSPAAGLTTYIEGLNIVLRYGSTKDSAIELQGSTGNVTGVKTVLSAATDTYDLGSTTNRWAGVYAGILDASEALVVPQVAPTSPIYGNYYLYINPDGNYVE